MEKTTKASGNYRIEVSGWSLDSNFFVEKTDLFWDQCVDKKVSLHHIVPEGAIIFVRLLMPEAGGCTLPVAYRAAAVQPMDFKGLCEMRLTQLHPRTRIPHEDKRASYSIEDSASAYEPSESSAELAPEEILQ